MNDFKGLYPGQTAWIVGKGPSLLHLRKEHLGEGPVITINESILIVQELGLSNSIYSMQKDGEYGIGHAVHPRMYIPVILQRPGYSENDLPLHPLRTWVAPEDYGFHHAEMSIRLCVAIAKEMECGRITFVCCDSLVNGDVRRVDAQDRRIVRANSGSYVYVKPLVLKDVEDIPHEFVLPEETPCPTF